MLLLSGPNIAGNEWKYVKDCLDTGWVSSVGSYVDRFERMSAEYAGTRYAVATSSGSTALHICLILQGVGAGDYVLAPNVTFVATCNTIRYVGAEPILFDADPDTWQMDLDLLEDFLRTKTERSGGTLTHRGDGRRIAALMPVHVLGNLCDMSRLMRLAEEFGLPVIEDSTEALGSFYEGRHAGSFGRFGTFSYNGNKIITTGGGGMIITDDADLARKAKHLTTQAKSDAFEYKHDEIGYNYRLTNVAAAMGVAQMEQLPGFVQSKKHVMELYKSQLHGIGDIRFQQVDPAVDANCWLVTIQSARQKDLLKALNAESKQSRPFWVPMNQLPMYRHCQFVQRDDRSDFLYQTCLSVPCSTNITDAEVEGVCATIRRVMAG